MSTDGGKVSKVGRVDTVTGSHVWVSGSVVVENKLRRLPASLGFKDRGRYPGVEDRGVASTGDPGVNDHRISAGVSVHLK